jgi:chitin disaccharide deacetylase
MNKGDGVLNEGHGDPALSWRTDPHQGNRVLIVNADDFGLSQGVNRGIIEAHEHGIVTSASLMVRWPAAVEAAAYVRERGNLDLGLHLDLGEWTCSNGTWSQVYEVIPDEDEMTVRTEVQRQLEAFHELTGSNPTHIDSHQHVHRQQPVRAIVRAAARDLGIPVRHFSPDIHYCGEFYGQTGTGEPYRAAISTDALISVLQGLPEGITELCCHPGRDDDLDTMYRDERKLEVATLCHPSVRDVLNEARVRLWSFATLLNNP